MKRGRDGGARVDRVEVDVGGTLFTSSVSTLSSCSAYFAALFSRWDEDVDEMIFLDRDADSFRVLLSCMRQRRALMPENNPDLFRRVLLDAQFLGMDWLEVQIKAKLLDHDDDAAGVLESYNRRHAHEAAFNVLKYAELNDEQKAGLFNEEYQSIDNAFRLGLLPGNFFAKKHPVENRRKVTQLIPAPTGSQVVFYDAEHEDQGRESRRALCLALVEDSYGNTHIEPVVRGRGIRKPPEDEGAGAWLTVEANEQLVTASEYQDPAASMDDDLHWAFAYSSEADSLIDRNIREQPTR